MKMKETKSSGKLVKGMLLGAAAGLAVMLMLCLLGGVLLSKEVIPESALAYVGWSICAIAAWVGCWLGQRKAGSGRLPVSLGCGGFLLLVMLIIGTVGEEEKQLTWYSAAIVAAAAVISALLGSGKKKRRF